MPGRLQGDGFPTPPPSILLLSCLLRQQTLLLWFFLGYLSLTFCWFMVFLMVRCCHELFGSPVSQAAWLVVWVLSSQFPCSPRLLLICFSRPLSLPSLALHPALLGMLVPLVGSAIRSRIWVLDAIDPYPEISFTPIPCSPSICMGFSQALL